MGKNAAIDADRLEKAIRNREILRLRIDERLDYATIGERFGITKQRVGKIIDSCIKVQTREKAETLRGIEGVRLERLQTKARKHTDSDDPLVSLRGMEVEIKIHARRAKLFGLDAPERHEMTGADGAPIKVEDKTEVTAAVARAAMRQLFGGVGPVGNGTERGIEPDAPGPEGKPPPA